MRKFCSELLTPKQIYLPIPQHENDIQEQPVDSILESVLTSEDNNPLYSYEEKLTRTISWDEQIQDALAEVEKKTETIQADYSKWNYRSIINAAISSLVPPATYTTLWGLNSYVSFPVTHTPNLIALYNQLQEALLVFKPVQSAFNYLPLKINNAFWNMIKFEGAEYITYSGGVYLANNCFWKQGYEMYPNNNFTFPAEFKGNYLGYGEPVFLRKQESSLSEYPGLICEYFSSNRSLIPEIRIPAYEHCQFNLNAMCELLTRFQKIIPEHKSLGRQIELLERDINDQGGNYQFISNTVFWSVLIPVTLCTTGWLMYLGYFNYKNRQDMHIKLEHFQNNPLQLDAHEAENMRNIVGYLNQIMPGEDPISLEEDKATRFTNKLINRREKLHPHFHFFKFCKITLPRELTCQIMEHVYAPI